MTRLTAALEAANDPAADPLHVAKVHGLMTAYDAVYRDEADRYEPAPLEDGGSGIEAAFELPVINPDTGRRQTPFKFLGRIDGLVRDRQTGKLLLLEHKTTSEAIHGGADYWRRLTIDTQLSLYALALHQLGLKVSGILYDVIAKPGISPRLLTKAEVKAALESNTWQGYSIGEECRLHIAEAEKPRETPRLYAARLARDAIQDADGYLGRRVIIRTPAEILEAAYTLRDIALEIQGTRRNGRFTRNTFQCLSKFGACPFLAACCNGDTATEDGYRHRKTPEEHAATINQLSHTRLESWAKCKKLYQWTYERNLEPTRERSDALAFGDLMHRALAAWWETPAMEDAN